MDKKNTILVALLVLSIIIVFIMGIILFKVCSDKYIAERKIVTLSSDINNLQNKVSQLQSTVDNSSR